MSATDHADADASPLPEGPCLIYVTKSADLTVITPVDRQAIDDPRDRALCRALLGYAIELLDKAEKEASRYPVGFQARKDS